MAAEYTDKTSPIPLPDWADSAQVIRDDEVIAVITREDG